MCKKTLFAKSDVAAISRERREERALRAPRGIRACAVETSRRALLSRSKSTMASFTMSTARLAAPAKVSGLGFRKAISAVRLAAKPAPVATKAVAMTVCKTKAKPGHGKAKTNKSAAKRFKITASGKVRLRPPPRLASRARARSRRARISHRRIGFRVCSSEVGEREHSRKPHTTRRERRSRHGSPTGERRRARDRKKRRSQESSRFPRCPGKPFRPDPAADRLASPPFFFPIRARNRFCTGARGSST
jgi:large subunit ribosomal protein L35